MSLVGGKKEYVLFLSFYLNILLYFEFRILYANVGMNGRVSDGGIWARCDLKTRLETNSLNLPDAACLPGSSIKTNYHIVSDDAFPLGLNVMKPYSQKNVTGNIPNRIFNYRYTL